MIPDAIKEVADDVLNYRKKRRAKVRTLLGFFGYSRRRDHVVRQISQALESQGLKTEPDFQDEFFDNQVCFVLVDACEDDGVAAVVDGIEEEAVVPEIIEEYEPPKEIREPITPEHH